MTYRLFGRPYSGSLAVEWLLEELALPYDRVLVTGYRDKIEPAWYRDINPIGQVPALELPDGTLMTESGAIMLYLPEAAPEAGLAPATGDRARRDYLRLMTFLAATIYPTMMRYFHPENYIQEADRFEAVKAYAVKDLTPQWRMIEAALEATGYLAGSRLSAADIFLMMFAVWADGSLPGFLDVFPRTRTFMEMVGARPAIAVIFERHKSGAWSD
jgi:glutathione S-transferase/GST-like protein